MECLLGNLFNLQIFFSRFSVDQFPDFIIGKPLPSKKICIIYIDVNLTPLAIMGHRHIPKIG